MHSLSQKSLNKLQELKIKYDQSLGEKWNKLSKLWGELDVDDSIDSAKNLASELHKLAGSAALYGHEDITEVSKRTESKLIAYIADKMESAERPIKNVVAKGEISDLMKELHIIVSSKS